LPENKKKKKGVFPVLTTSAAGGIAWEYSNRRCGIWRKGKEKRRFLVNVCKEKKKKRVRNRRRETPAERLGD